MFGVKTSIIPIISGCLITTLFVSISTNGRLSNYNHRSFTHSHHYKRQLMDQVLTDVNPLTEKIPIVNHGLPPLSSLVFNATVTKVCEQLEKVKSNQAEVLYAGALGYIASVDHYMSSSAALPTCVFRPATSNDVVQAMKMIEKEKVKFSINSGKHTGNPYFSSTAGGLQIDMRKFTKIQLSNDHTEVDVGPGNVWENVYDKLQGTDRIVLGGRVSGVGVGGFLLGGGGYSYLTQKYGMAADSIISMDIVVPHPARLLTISKDSYPDLFWAAKGGGNQFGVVINFKLKTFPISSTVWGGTRLYAGHDQKLKDASLQFVNEVKDKNAAAVLEFLYFGRIPLFAAEAFYDGAKPPNGTFDMFPSGGLLEPLSNSWGPGKMSNIVRSVPDNFTDDLRGYFNSVSLQKFTPGILKVALDELEKLNADLSHSGMYFHIALEWAGKDYGAYAIGKDTSPFPYYKSPQPLELYFAWIDPLDDQFYHSAINEMADKIRAEATREGQQVEDLPIYPNYAIDNTHAVNLFGQTNAVRLKSIKQKYDPDNTMRLTTWYAF